VHNMSNTNLTVYPGQIIGQVVFVRVSKSSLRGFLRKIKAI